MKLFFLLLLTLSFGCSGHKAHKKYHRLSKAVHSDYRSNENKVRDTYRHPMETLLFFEVEPDMKVVEISPGGGWYTEILGPYLRKKGELHLAIFSEKTKRSYAPKLNEKIKTITQDKKHFGNVKFSVLETPMEIGPIAPDNSVDRVLTFRNVHNWMKDNKANEVFTAFYKALKPGGILGVVEHRGKMNKAQDPIAKSGYVREDYLIDLAKSVGFTFVAKSEINANYLDDSNHPEGVWTLPPSLRLKEKNESKYLAIGESDRMTLKFMKPIK